MKFALLLFAVYTSLACATPHGQYPDDWWTPVPKDTAPGWEVLPQDAGPGEVILSKRNELGILSNFAATPFTLDGTTYGSVEGLWQSTKYPEGPNDERLNNPNVVWKHTRAEVAAMNGFEAKGAGNHANENMRALGIDWVTYQGKKMKYLEKAKGDFYQVIWRAENAKMKQNSEVEGILRKTGDLILRPDHKQSPDSAPAWKYHEIWMEIRKTL